MTTPTRRDYWAIVFAIGAVGNLFNGAWMLWNPEHWYFNLPANVPGSGPLNEHFIRDIGSIFAVMGLWLLVAVRRPSLRLPAMLTVTGWNGFHALVHAYDQERGLFEPEQLRYDFPAVYGPTILLAVLAFFIWRQARATT